LDYICRRAEGIAMLEGWEDSKGARAEHAIAVALGLKIRYLDEPEAKKKPARSVRAKVTQTHCSSGVTLTG
jgi:uncharacterized protein DUF4406